MKEKENIMLVAIAIRQSFGDFGLRGPEKVAGPLLRTRSATLLF